MLLFGLFGWKVAALYLGTGLADRHRRRAGSIGRLQHGALRRGLGLRDATPARGLAEERRSALGGPHRARAGEAVREIVGKVWPYVLAGIAVGAGIHGYVPEELHGVASWAASAWWSRPAGGADRHPDVLERRRHHPGRRRRCSARARRSAPCSPS
ncbi:MAG: hypothetical protein MZV49_07155 [Rhodopseudomonas palustris]|nr:hypothetical protein [Rhodopseudomonas palustris]